MSSQNQHVNKWVDEVAKRLKPDRVVWINGSDQEYKDICELLIAQGKFTRLNEKEYPSSFWARSHPNDVARVEERTFICSTTKDEAGPTNNWCDPKEMYIKLNALMEGCMKGRTMYVVAYLMGPDSSPYAKVGFELTDSAYVVANMRTMARIGDVALKNLKNESNDFVRGIHSYGTLNPEQRYICHFPEDKAIISFNSDYGGNALQGKKCFALRIASTLARKEGWLAEHMLILGITNPKGEKIYVTGAFPSACGKTNLAMLIPPEDYKKAGWKVETVGDDIAWLNFGPDGRLYAINPEAGFFGVAPGTSNKTNPNAMATIRGNTIFTNTALDLDNNVPWWEGMGETPKRVMDWLGNDWSPEDGSKAAHPNSRFTAPVEQCPCLDPNWKSPQGVPISAIIFGGRRARTAPLVYQAFNWQHGTFVGMTMASEMTAAAEGKLGQVRRDPMAMLPFIGYNAADYFKHWLDIAKTPNAKMPNIFHVNWFRTDENGKFIWPGFGENMRVLEWIFNQSTGKSKAIKTAIGLMPTAESLNLSGLNIAEDKLNQILGLNKQDWVAEVESQKEFLTKMGSRLPKEIWDEYEALKSRVESIWTNSSLALFE